MSEEDQNKPQELADADLDAANGGLNFGNDFSELNSEIVSMRFVDEKMSSKVLFAQRSGGGNVAGNGGAPTPSEYNFEEDIGDDIIPVTYRLRD